MSINIVSGQSAIATANNAGNAAMSPQAQAGSRGGEGVKIQISAQSLAADMQEEIGAAFSERAEKKQGKKRSLKPDNAELAKRVEQVKKIDDYLNKLPDLKNRKDEISDITQRSRQQSFSSKDELLDYLKNELSKHEDPDPVQVYAVLEHISHTLDDSDSEQLRSIVEEATNSYLAENGREIHSGMIISESAALYASEALGSMVDLRNLYMAEVAADAGIGHTFCSIMEKYGEKGFTDAVEYLIRAAGADMSSMSSNVDKNQQKAVIDNLYQLEVVKTTYDQASVSVKRLEGFYSGVPENAAFKIMQGTFEAVDRPFSVSANQITKLADSVLSSPIEGKIAVLREVRTVLSNLPLRTYSQDTQEAIRNKDRIMDSVVEAQDIADEIEQDMLENE
ncbi:HrpJ domain-containing protein [Terasakiella pusilla]|uniref:HrpJ domain-containing protein n=1 Tax=Terasakiella pusilla TaxID=64973 RepID=UPI00048C7D9A|nr:HrpJ domain-containing protein [Terasakiella pusilla]